MCSSSRWTLTVRVGTVSVAREAVELLLVREILAVGAGGDQRLDDLTRMAAPLHHVEQLLVRDHLVKQLFEIRAGYLDAGRRNPDHPGFGGPLDQDTPRAPARP